MAPKTITQTYEVELDNGQIYEIDVEEPSKKGFLSKAGELITDVTREATRPFITSLARVGQAAQVSGMIPENLGGTKEAQTFEVPFYGKIPPPKSIKESIGTAIKTPAIALGPVAGGAAFMGGQALEEEKPLSEVALKTAGGAIIGKGGEIVSKGVGLGLSQIGKGLKFLRGGGKIARKSAEKTYAGTLGATTKTEKALAEKVAPEMAKRKLFAFTKEGLKKQSEEGVEKAGQELSEAYAKLPKDMKFDITGTLKRVKNIQEELKINGIIPESNKVVFETLDELQNELINISSKKTKIPIETIRNYRQMLDNAIKQKGKGIFGLTGLESSKLEAQKIFTNTLRNELGKATPNIAKINSDFTFWSRVDDILEKSLARKKSGGLLKIAGGVIGGEKVSTGIGIITDLGKLTRSTAWKTLSARTKSQIADAISSGKNNLAKKLISNLAEGIGTTLEKTGEGISKIPQALKNLPKIKIK